LADILVIGSLNMDLVVKTTRLPKPGETIQGEGLRRIPGGKGANQAVAAAKLGKDVHMVGRVGEDSFGQSLISGLSQHGVDTKNVIVDPDAPTGTAVILVDELGENCIVISSGSNGKVTKGDINNIADEIKRARVILLQFEIPIEAVEQAINIAHENGVYIILNPAPANEISQEIIGKVDLLVPNETEASLLTGIEVTDKETAAQAGGRLLAQGVKTVIITLGKEGAKMVTDEGVTHIAAHDVEAIDTTAAGDAFVGGLATALVDNLPLPEAVKYGCSTGTLATTKLGAQTSLPDKEEVDAFYQRVYGQS
jgi:ribokinase